MIAHVDDRNAVAQMSESFCSEKDAQPSGTILLIDLRAPLFRPLVVSQKCVKCLSYGDVIQAAIARVV